MLLYKLVVLLGIVACFMHAKKKKPALLVLSLFIGTLIATMHFVITKPLLGKWMEPGHLLNGVDFPLFLFFAFGAVALVQIITKNIKTGLNSRLAYLLVILIICVPGIFNNVNAYKKDQWTQYGMTMDPNTQSLYDLGSWLEKNVKNDETILANDESAFMINAMSGKRVVFSRRVHASYFEDVDQKYADGVVMLFGNNAEQTKSLLKKYNTKYVYVDSFLTSYPIVVNLKYEAYLKSAGISYTIQDVRLDPSGQSNPTFTSLVVAPNMTSSALFNQDNNMTVPAQAFYVNGQIGSIIYAVKN
jgi:hypothetical protein